MAVQRVEEHDYPAVSVESPSASEQEFEGLPRAERTRVLLAAAAASPSPSERTALEERVIETNLVIAEQLAARYRQRGVPDDDLKQVASRRWSRRLDATSTPRTVTSCRSPSRPFAASSADTSVTSGGPSGRQDGAGGSNPHHPRRRRAVPKARPLTTAQRDRRTPRPRPRPRHRSARRERVLRPELARIDDAGRPGMSARGSAKRKPASTSRRPGSSSSRCWST